MKNVTLVALALSFALAACSDSNTGTVSFALTARQETGATLVTLPLGSTTIAQQV